MARKPKANSHDHTIRNVIIGFSVIILIVGALLIWNNRSLSFAVTIDGERIPIEQFNFYHNQAWNTLWEWGMMPGPETEAWTMEIAFESLVSLHLTSARASEFGFSLADVDADEVTEEMEFLRMILQTHEGDIIPRLGFTDAAFRQFVELRMLQGLVHEHITSLVEVDEEELEQVFEDFWEENHMHFTEILVHTITVETRAEADELHSRIVNSNESFVELMREYSNTFNEEVLPLDDAGNPILAENIHASILGQWGQEHIELAHDMEVGDVSEVLSIAGGSWVIFEVAEVNPTLDGLDRLELEINVKAEHEAELRNAYFHERFELWRENADIVPNDRILSGF